MLAAGLGRWLAPVGRAAGEVGEMPRTSHRHGGRLTPALARGFRRWIDAVMGARRWVLVVTAVVVRAVAVTAAVGVAVWAALPGLPPQANVRVSNTGRAVAGRGGRANSGASGKAPQAQIQVDRTGEADASKGDGEANSGVELD